MRRQPPPRRPAPPAESAAAEAATVAWLLAALTTLVCLAAAALGGWLLARQAQPEPRAAALAALGMLGSLVTGTLALMLTPLIWRLRRERPPHSVTIGVVIVGALPWLWMVGRAVMG